MKTGSSNQLKSGNSNLKGPSSKSRKIQKRQQQNKGLANSSPSGGRRRRHNKFNKNNIRSEGEASNFGKLEVIFKQTKHPSSNAPNQKGKRKGKGKNGGGKGNQKNYHGQVHRPQQPEHDTVPQDVSSEEKQIQVRPIPDDLPKEALPYWGKRYELFSLYDLGILLDIESWWSVTPEKIAQAIAHHCFRRNQGIVLDAFCGCGGNAIQFAKYFAKVIAIDIDHKKVEYARHNAKIYGVQDKIIFMSGDSTEIAPLFKQVDLIFLSPPWGGPGYRNQKVFDIERGIQLKSATGTTGGMNGIKLFYWAQSITPNVAYFLPKNVDQNQVKALEEPCKIQFNYVRTGKRQGLTAYFGDLAVDSTEEPLQV